MDVFGRVEISVLNVAAGIAHKQPLPQREDLLDCFAAVAHLRRGLKPADDMQLTVKQRHLICQLAATFAPAHVADRTGQMLVFDQALHMQILDADGLVFAAQLRGQLVKSVVPDMGNAGVNLRHLMLGFPQQFPLLTL